MSRRILPLLFLVAYAQGQPGDCPDGFSFFANNGKCYKVFEEKQGAVSAALECFKHGATMASFHSQDETDFVANLAGRAVLIGLFSHDMKNFSWIDGSPLDYTAWAPDEPSVDKKGENCVVLFGPEYKENEEWRYKWNNLPCDFIDPYVCMVDSKVGAATDDAKKFVEFIIT